MKAPAEVQLGPYTYEVICNRAAFDRVQVEEKQELCGRQKLITQKIHLNPEMGPDAKADTLLHECMHHFFRCSALVQIDEGDEEQIVNFLATNILSLLRDNPDLVSYLCDSG